MKNWKLVLISFVLFLIIIGCFFTVKKIIESKVYEGYAVVEKMISFSKAEALVMDDEEKSKGKAIIYSNLFKKDDKVKITYSKKDKGYIIRSVELIDKDELSNISLYNNVKKNTALLTYKVNTVIKAIPEDPQYDEAYPEYLIVPIKLKNQDYKLLNPLEWFEAERDSLKGYDCDCVYAEIFDEGNINIKIEDVYQVVSLELIDSDNTKQIDYQHNDQEIKFNFNEHGTYSLVLEFENKDIINYLIVL